MIKNNECVVLITTRNKKYYKENGFICEPGDKLHIDISSIPKMSHNKVIAICEICGCENEISYSKYNINFNRGGFYSCKKCSNKKRKETNTLKYGVDVIFKRDDIRENNKMWMSSIDFRNKSIKTQIDKYGCLFVQTENFKNENSVKLRENIKIKKEKGEYICTLSNPDNIELREKSMFEKYGHTYSFHVESIKDKIQKVNFEKYGHISPFGNKEIQEKIKTIFIEKYGFDNPFKNSDIQKKIKSKRESKYKDIDIESFREYRRLVRFHTNKNKSSLFENWDGNDYYDGEYIKDFLLLDSNSLKYPTIDHKKSCIYGFKNNISPEDISRIENLCITKRIINSKKSHLNEDEFIKIITS